jgi:hypothetical protein
MKNASVAAIVYEFLFEVYRKIEIDRISNNVWRFTDSQSVSRELFFHEYMSCWEATDFVLSAVGLLAESNCAFGFPTATLKECSEIDFSDFETFDNYCV